MTIDSKLAALFDQARQTFDRDVFLAGIMRRIDRERRRSILVWSCMGLVLVAACALLAVPVTTAASMASELLPVSLVDIETEWLRLLLAPINSVAAAIAVGVIAIRKFFGRISS